VLRGRLVSAAATAIGSLPSTSGGADTWVSTNRLQIAHQNRSFSEKYPGEIAARSAAPSGDHSQVLQSQVFIVFLVRAHDVLQWPERAAPAAMLDPGNDSDSASNSIFARRSAT